MFTAALKAAKTRTSNHRNDDFILSSQCLPEKYSLEQLYDEIVDDEDAQIKRDELPKLLVISSCLSDSARLETASDDEEYASKISQWIAKSILPSGDLIPSDEIPEEPLTASKQSAALLAQRKGIVGLTSLQSLHNLAPIILTANNSVLLSLLAFTSERDPWTTPLSLTLTTTLLSSRVIYKHTHSEDFIIHYLLQSFIRPLFSLSKPDSITAAGRKAMPSSAPRTGFDVNQMERASRPWKYDACYAVTVFGWAVENVSSSTLATTWHIFIPPLLTLLDEVATPLRVRALCLLSTFLPSLTPKLLSQTGLGSVFEDTLMPILLYLPTLTPVSESLQLLPAAYKALFALNSVRFSAVSSSSLPSSSKNDEKERLDFLDRLMRKGILTGYLHASTHPEIVAELLIQLQTLVPLLGIHTVKHLSHILAMITVVITDPFSTARPGLLSTAVKTLQILILNTWPRMSDQGHRMEIVKALVLCWQSVDQELAGGKSRSSDKVQALEEVKEGMKVVACLLATAVQPDGDVDFQSEVSLLIKADESLGALFIIDSKK